MRLRDPCFKIRDQDLSVLSVPSPRLNQNPERETWGGGGGRGLVRQISSDGNDRKDFFGFEFFDFGIFFGRKSLASSFWVA